MDRDSVKPLKDLLDSVRDIDGFPIGKDEDILALSDPPFYTACPNPYIKEFIEEYGTPYDPETDDYHREPYTGDVTEGKGDPLYNIHTYHTKVPPKAIIQFINHYTKPRDIVFDGFCGSGMTGVAVQLSHRRAILSDLSPIATFISKNYNRLCNLEEFEEEANRILTQLTNDLGWLYTTRPQVDSRSVLNIDNKNENKGLINYMVWIDILKCPYCNNDFDSFTYESVDDELLEKVTSCPHCHAEISGNPERSIMTYHDSVLNADVEIAKQKPILIDYLFLNQNYKKEVDTQDIELINKIEKMEIPYWFPNIKIPEGHNTNQPINSHNYQYIHQMYTKRNLWSASSIYEQISQIKNINTRHLLMFWFTSLCIGQTRMNRYFEKSYSQVNRYLKGTLYVGKKTSEVNPLYSHANKIKRIKKYLAYKHNDTIISTNSATQLNIDDNSVDYIFTDPPFGGNIMYSELNLIWESWLKVKTNNRLEAITNEYQNKGIDEYTQLMTSCFTEFFRILKPNRWITVVFHNSKASVWNAIQQAMIRAGFIVAYVTTLDKKQETFKQMTAPGSTKNDLIINAYKPHEEFADRFLKTAGEGMEVDFIFEQLEHLPLRPNVGRTEKMLFSKMLAHYVENGFKIKYNSTNFYKLLSDNFTELDRYWFLDSQVKEYNKWKSGLSLDELRERLSDQQILLITDEKSALTWLYYFLAKPRTYSDIYTGYQQVATTSNDAIPELKDLLENNFILDDGKYRRPLSESEISDVKKNQEKEMERAFNKLLKQAKEDKGKIKNVRREALVYGFTKCYQKGRYQDILAVAGKLYASTLEASGEIMDFVDIARIKTAGEKDGL